MGTSTPFGGPGSSTPLIPSWLTTSDSAAPASSPPPSPPSAEPEHRFSAARNNFTRFAGSGGNDTRTMRRALAHYVHTSAGGSKTAVRRMGTSRTAAARLASFLAEAQIQGAAHALRTLNLDRLEGLPVEQVFLGLRDVICPSGGSIDEGIACEAFMETITELSQLGLTTWESLSSAEVEVVLELFILHTIEARLYNDVGANHITAPQDVRAAHRVQRQLRDFIKGCVSDAFTDEDKREVDLRLAQARVDRIYELSFHLLQILSESEAA